jgi:hypothetical protein
MVSIPFEPDAVRGAAFNMLGKVPAEDFEGVSKIKKVGVTVRATPQCAALMARHRLVGRTNAD